MVGGPGQCRSRRSCRRHDHRSDRWAVQRRRRLAAPDSSPGSFQSLCSPLSNMPRKKRGRRRAPNHAWKQKKDAENSTITEKLIENYNTGASIPIIDKATYESSCPKKVAFKSHFKNKSHRVPAKGSKSTQNEAENKPLPQPKFSIIEDYYIPDMKFKPTDYVKYVEPTKKDIDARIDYDLDEEDTAWLERENSLREQNGAPPVPEKEFEILLDRFEKESYFEISRRNGEELPPSIAEDEAICCICLEGEGQAYNEIIFCDMCDLAVHQECYGVPYIPDGQWLCRKCIHSPSIPVDCLLCPNTFGAFKKADGEFWAHLICSIMIPEVHFVNPVFLEPVEVVARVPSSRFKLCCTLCKMKGVGACIKCQEKKCQEVFHPTCGQQAGYYMKFVGRPGDPKTKTNRFVYCATHKPKIEKGCDRFEPFRQKMLKSVRDPVVFFPKVPPEKIQVIAERVNFENKNHFVKKSLAYWFLKRLYRLGVPLVRLNNYELKKNLCFKSKAITVLKSQSPTVIKNKNSKNSKSRPKPTQSSGQSKSTVYKPQIKKPKFIPKITQKEYLRLKFLRRDMERVRLLLELVKKRERVKLEKVRLEEQIIKMKLMPLSPFLRNVLDKLRELDEDNIFAEPVNTKEVPSYLEIIKEPMDFSTMSANIECNYYQTLGEFLSHFNLIIENCLRFNKKNSFYYKAGLELRKRSKGIIKQAYAALKKTNFSPLKKNKINPARIEAFRRKSGKRRRSLTPNKRVLERGMRRKRRKVKRECVEEIQTGVKMETVSDEKVEVDAKQGSSQGRGRISTLRGGKEYTL